MIPPDKQDAFKELLRRPHQIGRDFWTARALHGRLAQNWQIQMGYLTLCQDQTEREQFRREIAQLLEDPQTDVWLSDETGVEGDPRPRRRWSEKGVACTVPYTGDRPQSLGKTWHWVVATQMHNPTAQDCAPNISLSDGHQLRLRTGPLRRSCRLSE